LSEHAREALAKRRIEIAWVERVLRAPEAIEPDAVDPELEHRIARIPEFGGRALRVIVKSSITPPLVVTAFFDRRRNVP